MAFKFHVADSLTGRVLGQLYPNEWSLPDPLRSPGAGTLKVPIPTAEAHRVPLRELIKPRMRFVTVEDDDGRLIWSGPIPPRIPGHSQGELTIPVVDWRAWFYSAYIRPVSDTVRQDYVKVGGSAREQCLIMTDLAALALDTAGAPRFSIDTAPDSDTTRELTANQLDRSIGELLDSITERAGGCEWHTYTTRDGDTLLPHFAVAWPERSSTSNPARLEYVLGKGGNAHDFSWPEGSDAFTRAWAISGEPPDQIWASDEYSELEDETDVAWETVLRPDDVTRKSTAQEYASGEIDRSQSLSGQAEFSVLHEKIPLGSITTGDRAHVILWDGWTDVDVPAARIVDRTLSGGRNQPTTQRIVIDLADDAYPDDGTTPGEAVDGA